ncbi:hypothetical protein PSPTOT1_2586 [Pseudomonas syringae pv. tomato T1]|nr:hypothetical protein PSPTOT1_2586 [Pseudomonas syringae pv. tomato T1]
MNEFTCLVFLYDCSEVSVGHVYDRTFINKIFTNGDTATAMKLKNSYTREGWRFLLGVWKRIEQRLRHAGCKRRQ